MSVFVCSNEELLLHLPSFRKRSSFIFSSDCWFVSAVEIVLKWNLCITMHTRTPFVIESPVEKKIKNRDISNGSRFYRINLSHTIESNPKTAAINIRRWTFAFEFYRMLFGRSSCQEKNIYWTKQQHQRISNQRFLCFNRNLNPWDLFVAIMLFCVSIYVPFANSLCHLQQRQINNISCAHCTLVVIMVESLTKICELQWNLSARMLNRSDMTCNKSICHLHDFQLCLHTLQFLSQQNNFLKLSINNQFQCDRCLQSNNPNNNNNDECRERKTHDSSSCSYTFWRNRKRFSTVIWP